MPPLFVRDRITSRSWAIPFPGARERTDDALHAAIDGKTVLITGASSGIGEAAARKVAAAGARTLLVARSADVLDALATELGNGATALPTDLSEPDQIGTLIEAVTKELGRVDVLVNNAGKSIRRSVYRSVDRPHDYERVMALNYFGPLRLILGLLPAMLEHGDGHIVNVSTMGVQIPAPRFGAYLASKAALDTFTRVLEIECGPRGIDCTTVHMPLVRTPMIEPSRIYDRMPALTAEQGAELVCEAIRRRPRYVDLPPGAIGQVAGALVPGLVSRAMNLAYRAGTGRRG